MFTERDPKLHGELRRKFASLYSMTSLLRVEGYASECGEILIRKLDDFVKSREVIDLQ